jgi:hypothetical protein
MNWSNLILQMRLDVWVQEEKVWQDVFVVEGQGESNHLWTKRKVMQVQVWMLMGRQRQG